MTTSTATPTPSPDALPIPEGAKHTPGPWCSERLRLDGHEWFVKSECRNLPPCSWLPRLNVKIGALMPVSGSYVNSTLGTGSTDSGCCSLAITENAANARLIAASPDLLEALRSVLPFLRTAEALWEDAPYPDVLASKLARAEAAIRLALTGER